MCCFQSSLSSLGVVLVAKITWTNRLCRAGDSDLLREAWGHGASSVSRGGPIQVQGLRLSREATPPGKVPEWDRVRPPPHSGLRLRDALWESGQAAHTAETPKTSPQLHFSRLGLGEGLWLGSLRKPALLRVGHLQGQLRHLGGLEAGPEAAPAFWQNQGNCESIWATIPLAPAPPGLSQGTGGPGAGARGRGVLRNFSQRAGARGSLPQVTVLGGH